jgi:hypothetical protein
MIYYQAVAFFINKNVFLDLYFQNENNFVGPSYMYWCIIYLFYILGSNNFYTIYNNIYINIS